MTPDMNPTASPDPIPILQGTETTLSPCSIPAHEAPPVMPYSTPIPTTMPAVATAKIKTSLLWLLKTVAASLASEASFEQTGPVTARNLPKLSRETLCTPLAKSEVAEAIASMPLVNVPRIPELVITIWKIL